MIKKNMKKPLLNQDVPYLSEGQWICMEDIKPNGKKERNKEKQYGYKKIQNQSQFNHLNKKDKYYQQQIKRTQPYNPNIIKMNGQIYKKVQNNEGKSKKKSKIPHMHVSCRYCDTLQSVEGTATQYLCLKCSKINYCTPIYKIFICCSCHTKVLYATGISNIIRCTKCNMINKIPEIFNNNPYQIIKQPIQQIYYVNQNEKETELYPYEVISDLRSEASIQNQYITYPARENHIQYPQL